MAKLSIRSRSEVAAWGASHHIAANAHWMQGFPYVHTAGGDAHGQAFLCEDARSGVIPNGECAAYLTVVGPIDTRGARARRAGQYPPSTPRWVVSREESV
jgi:hypothetical protein